MTSPKVRNWDGKAQLPSLPNLVAAHQSQGQPVQIGHWQGTVGLFRMSTQQAQAKPPNDN